MSKNKQKLVGIELQIHGRPMLKYDPRDYLRFLCKHEPVNMYLIFGKYEFTVHWIERDCDEEYNYLASAITGQDIRYDAMITGNVNSLEDLQDLLQIMRREHSLRILRQVHSQIKKDMKIIKEEINKDVRDEES